VVLAGLACALPEADTAPPGVTATAVAPVVLQLSVVYEPAATLDGLAVKLLITGSTGAGVGVVVGVGAGVGVDAAVTVTDRVRVTLPAALVAVSI